MTTILAGLTLNSRSPMTLLPRSTIVSGSGLRIVCSQKTDNSGFSWAQQGGTAQPRGWLGDGCRQSPVCRCQLQSPDTSTWSKAAGTWRSAARTGPTSPIPTWRRNCSGPRSRSALGLDSLFGLISMFHNGTASDRLADYDGTLGHLELHQSGCRLDFDFDALLGKSRYSISRSQLGRANLSRKEPSQKEARLETDWNTLRNHCSQLPDCNHTSRTDVVL